MIYLCMMEGSKDLVLIVSIQNHAVFFFFLSFRHPADGRAQQGENLHVQNPFFLRDCQNKMLPGKESGKKCLAWHWRGHEEFFCPQPLLLFQNERAFNGIVWRADWKSWWRITHQHAYIAEECSQTFSEARNFKKKKYKSKNDWKIMIALIKQFYSCHNWSDVSFGY